MTDKIVVVSPSYKRGKELVPVAKYLPSVVVAVHEFEAEEYRKSGHTVKVIPDAVRGNMARVRNWIVETYAGARGVVMLDDDVSGIMVWENQRERKLTAEEVGEFLEHGFTMAEQWGAYLWGINMVYDKGAYREMIPFCTVRPVLGTFCGIRPNSIRYDEALPLKEDYDYAIQHLNKYRIILRFNKYCYVCGHNDRVGGCATYRTIRRERENFEILQKKWGSNIVRMDHGNDKASVRREGKTKTFDLNPKIQVPIAGV